MNVRRAWERGYTGKGVVVTILDDGIEKDHPDLRKNYVSMFFTSVQFQIYFVNKTDIHLFKNTALNEASATKS